MHLASHRQPATRWLASLQTRRLLLARGLRCRASARLPRLAASSTQDAAQEKVDKVKSEARGRVNKVVDDVEQKIDDDKQGSALEELIGGVRCCPLFGREIWKHALVHALPGRALTACPGCSFRDDQLEVSCGLQALS